MTSIVVGFPTCIGMVEFAILYKWCTYYDEEVDAELGGMTICEGIAYVLSCGKAFSFTPYETDNYVY